MKEEQKKSSLKGNDNPVKTFYLNNGMMINTFTLGMILFLLLSCTYRLGQRQILERFLRRPVLSFTSDEPTVKRDKSYRGEWCEILPDVNKPSIVTKESLQNKTKDKQMIYPTRIHKLYPVPKSSILNKPLPIKLVHIENLTLVVFSGNN